MKLFRKIILAVLLSFSFSLLPSFPALASQPDAPIVLDAYSMEAGEERELYVAGLVASGLDVLVYVDGEYSGLANISQKYEEINPFSFSSFIESKNKFYNISVISKDKVSGVLSAPASISDRRVNRPINSKPSLFKGGSSGTAVINTPATKQAAVKEPVVTKKPLTPPPAPTMVGPDLEDVVGTPRPLVLGLTQSGTMIHVYIDGVYNGKTKILEDKSGTANFAYQPFLNLEVGRHQVIVIAENSEGQKSPISKILYFRVEDRMVSPTISTNGQESFTKKDGLNLVGWAKNDSTIKVFIDQLLESQFSVKNDLSGTANFSYNSQKILKRGNHLVYATAVDSRGKESLWSNIIYFTIYEPQIATSAVEKTPTSTLGAFMEVKDLAKNETVLESKNVIKTKDVESVQNISGENDKKTEVKEEPGNLKTNLVIFILFLVAIAVWMFVVNRELIKENKKSTPKKD